MLCVKVLNHAAQSTGLERTIHIIYNSQLSFVWPNHTNCFLQSWQLKNVWSKFLIQSFLTCSLPTFLHFKAKKKKSFQHSLKSLCLLVDIIVSWHFIQVENSQWALCKILLWENKRTANKPCIFMIMGLRDPSSTSGVPVMSFFCEVMKGWRPCLLILPEWKYSR